MREYRRKHLTVLAREHAGPKITVNSALKGNQSAGSGDYLVTDPAAKEAKGSVYVVPKAEFERDHVLAPERGERAEARRNYPDYVSHKEVSAAKIASIHDDNGSLILHFEGDDLRDLVIPAEDLKNKPQPEPGWYLVVYDNGYTSFSPAQAFEEGYTPK